MNHSYFLLILIVCVAVGAAEITVTTSTTEDSKTAPLFTISGGDVLTVTPRLDLAKMVVFVDGKEVARYDEPQANERLTLAAGPGTHRVEVRALKTFTYAWEEGTTTENDDPLRLDYVKYDDNRDRLQFTLAGIDVVHPDDLAVLKDSNYAPLTTYRTMVNDVRSVECYPKVTTGKALFFSCVSGYARSLDLTVTVGVREAAEATVEEPVETESTNFTLPPTEQIMMSDTIKEPTHIPVTVFIILLFLAVMTILFVASHHKYENKLLKKAKKGKKRKK